MNLSSKVIFLLGEKKKRPYGNSRSKTPNWTIRQYGSNQIRGLLKMVSRNSMVFTFFFVLKQTHMR